MTKELAIRILTGDVLGTTEQTQEAVTMAVRALSLPDVTNINVGDTIYRQAAIDCVNHVRFGMDEMAFGIATTALLELPSAQPEWNNHTVACLLAELFDDTCACNYNGIDEWLPIKCELLESCPNPVGVDCWEQYLKHREERKTDENR